MYNIQEKVSDGGVMKLSFVIPCYRSEHTIESVLHEIEETIISKQDLDYQIILVNDSSPDKLSEKLRLCVNQFNNIKIIEFTKNFGQHAALMCGIRATDGDIVICLDDDGQTPANQVFEMIDELNTGYDVVYANYPQPNRSWFRNFGTIINNKMAELLISKPRDITMSSYFCMTRVIASEVVKYTHAYPYVGGLVLRSTNNIGKVMVNHRDRLHGTSGYTFKSLLKLWLNGFTAFSVKPLRIASVIGGFVSTSGILYGFYTIIQRLLNPEMPMGYASLIAVIVFIGGMNMLLLGLVGEYIGRMYISMNNSPQYVVKQEYSSYESH